SRPRGWALWRDEDEAPLAADAGSRSPLLPMSGVAEAGSARLEAAVDEAIEIEWWIARRWRTSLHDCAGSADAV
ncbi:MAG TPA: hypothetical protein VE549_11140, partial [Myxococcaceae bacterium]|nr:hypothetical protein [Myxococcaceae bacterium]